MNQQEKETKVYNVFQTIAENYDAANDRMSLGMQRGWKKHLTDAVFESFGIIGVINGATAENTGAVKILDLCCGTGDIAISLAQIAETKGIPAEIYGLDFSPAMLDIARKRCREAAPNNLKRINWVEGSAMQLPFEDNYFDAVTISFGLRNTPDFEVVLSEMKRVLKPGARLFVLDSFELKKGLVYPFYKFYFGTIIPIFERKFKDEYKWLNQSTELFLSPEELSDLMRKTGLTQISVNKYLFGACCLLSGTK